MGQLAFQIMKRPPETGGLGNSSGRPRRGRGVYAAACLRGGSSAPESWISATWWSENPSTWRRISSVCSPSKGDRVTSLGLSDILIGLPTEKYLPRGG